MATVTPTNCYNNVTTTITVVGTGPFVNGVAVVSITGAAFSSGTTALTTTWVNSTTLTASVPFGTAADVYNVTVNSPATSIPNGLVVQYALLTGHTIPDQYYWTGVLHLPALTRDPIPQPVMTITPPANAWLTITKGILALSDPTGYYEFNLCARHITPPIPDTPNTYNPAAIVNNHYPTTIRDLYEWFFLLGYAPTLTSTSYNTLAALCLVPTLDTPPAAVGQPSPTSPGIALTSGIATTLQRQTSHVWRFATTLADLAGSFQSQTRGAALELEVHTATGVWLNYWGILFGLPRDRINGLGGVESDARYRQRLILHMQYATGWPPLQFIQRMLSVAYGYSVVVYDRSPGEFHIKVTGIPTGSTPDTIILDCQHVADRYKAAGTFYSVDVVTALYFSDSMRIGIVDTFNNLGLPPNVNRGFAVDTANVAITERFSYKVDARPTDEP